MIKNRTITIGEQRWLVREARSMCDALDSIAHARCTGSIGDKCSENGALVADVQRYCDTCGGDVLLEVYGVCHNRPAPESVPAHTCVDENNAPCLVEPCARPLEWYETEYGKHYMDVQRHEGKV